MKDPAKRVLDFVEARQLLRAGERVCVAVSGGADSVALLRLLLELRAKLGIVLSVAHLNHRLRGAESEADASFVAALAVKHGLELHAAEEDVRGYAARQRLSLEAAGRELRYRFFARLLREGRVRRVATAHTADDQAETVLLRMIRGTGPTGLAGILPGREASGTHICQKRADVGDQAGILPGREAVAVHICQKNADVGDQPAGESPASTRSSIVRPLLSIRRAKLRAYLHEIGQEWREDASNEDRSFARNRVRAELLPLLERDYNGAVVAALSATAEIARAEEEFWEGEVARLLPGVLTEDGRLRAAELLRQPTAVQRRLVRQAAGTLDFERVEEVLEFAHRRGRAQRSLPLPGGRVAWAAEGELWFEAAEGARAEPAPGGYQYRLTVPGEVSIPELNRRITASVLPWRTATQGYNPQQFLDPLLVETCLSVRNWRAGDRFRPLHGKTPRKLKELLPKVPARERAGWPVVLSGDEIVWVRGLAVAHGRSAKNAKYVVVIDETPM